MEFLSKAAFYVMYGISCLIALFFYANALYTITQTPGKGKDALILLVGGILISVGLYLAYETIKTNERYLYGCGILGLDWLITLVVVIVAFFTFVPLHWQ